MAKDGGEERLEERLEERPEGNTQLSLPPR